MYFLRILYSRRFIEDALKRHNLLTSSEVAPDCKKSIKDISVLVSNLKKSRTSTELKSS